MTKDLLREKLFKGMTDETSENIKDLYVESNTFWNELCKLNGFSLRGNAKKGEHLAIITNGTMIQRVYLKDNIKTNEN